MEKYLYSQSTDEPSLCLQYSDRTNTPKNTLNENSSIHLLDFFPAWYFLWLTLSIKACLFTFNQLYPLSDITFVKILLFSNKKMEEESDSN